MGKNGMPNDLQELVAEHARYGGHDGKGGLQRPTDRHVSKPMSKPSASDTLLSEDKNKVPPTGPATGAGQMGGPVGTGSLQR
jgi:hypothetical protein